MTHVHVIRVLWTVRRGNRGRGATRTLIRVSANHIHHTPHHRHKKAHQEQHPCPYIFVTLFHKTSKIGVGVCGSRVNRFTLDWWRVRIVVVYCRLRVLMRIKLVCVIDFVYVIITLLTSSSVKVVCISSVQLYCIRSISCVALRLFDVLHCCI